MGYITTELIKDLVHDTRPLIFIETGTFKGGVLQRMIEDNTLLTDWAKVYTIELSMHCCRIAANRYRTYERKGVTDVIHNNLRDSDESFKEFNGKMDFFNGFLELRQGDSAEELKDILIDINEPVAFWLDAHTGGKIDFARGEDDVPLLRELNVIKEHIKSNDLGGGTHFIAIDDADNFGTIQKAKDGTILCDYSEVTLDKILYKLAEINQDYEVKIIQPFGMKMLVAYKGIK